MCCLDVFVQGTVATEGSVHTMRTLDVNCLDMLPQEVNRGEGPHRTWISQNFSRAPAKYANEWEEPSERRRQNCCKTQSTDFLGLDLYDPKPQILQTANCSQPLTFSGKGNSLLHQIAS